MGSEEPPQPEHLQAPLRGSAWRARAHLLRTQSPMYLRAAGVLLTHEQNPKNLDSSAEWSAEIHQTDWGSHWSKRVQCPNGQQPGRFSFNDPWKVRFFTPFIYHQNRRSPSHPGYSGLTSCAGRLDTHLLFVPVRFGGCWHPASSRAAPAGRDLGPGPGHAGRVQVENGWKRLQTADGGCKDRLRVQTYGSDWNRGTLAHMRTRALTKLVYFKEESLWLKYVSCSFFRFLPLRVLFFWKIFLYFRLIVMDVS